MQLRGLGDDARETCHHAVSFGLCGNILLALEFAAASVSIDMLWGEKMRILLVEDATDVAEPVVEWFTKKGDAVDHAMDYEAAETLLALQTYDVILLDINLPDGNGLNLLTAMRQKLDETPILMLTARLQVDDRVMALDKGADDYIVKPFDMRELESRVRAVARRSMRDPSASSSVQYGELEADLAARTATIAGEALQLTRREFSLLETLVARRGRVVAKQAIFESMFSLDDEGVGINAVEIYVGRLRKKLHGSSVEVRTLRGLGYQLVTKGEE